MKKYGIPTQYVAEKNADIYIKHNRSWPCYAPIHRTIYRSVSGRYFTKYDNKVINVMLENSGCKWCWTINPEN